MRTAAIIQDNKVVNVIVIADGEQGDETLDQFGGVEITELDPMPRIGWSYDDLQDEFLPTAEEIAAQYQMQSLIEVRESAKAKLAALGLTDEEIKALIG